VHLKKSRFQVFEKANFAALEIGRDRQFIFFIFKNQFRHFASGG
jgi:hypothetical protein